MGLPSLTLCSRVQMSNRLRCGSWSACEAPVFIPGHKLLRPRRALSGHGHSPVSHPWADAHHRGSVQSLCLFTLQVPWTGSHLVVLPVHQRTLSVCWSLVPVTMHRCPLLTHASLLGTLCVRTLALQVTAGFLVWPPGSRSRSLSAHRATVHLLVCTWTSRLDSLSGRRSTERFLVWRPFDRRDSLSGHPSTVEFLVWTPSDRRGSLSGRHSTGSLLVCGLLSVPESLSVHPATGSFLV